MDAIRYGASHYLLKPFNVTELLAIINQTLEKKRRLEILREALEECAALWRTETEAATAWTRIFERYDPVRPKTKPDAPPLSDTTLLLMELMEAYDRDLFNHCTRTSFYAALMGKQLKLSDGERKSLVLGAFLHDIGSILLHQSPGRQTGPAGHPKQHPELGARMLLPLRLPPEVGQIVLYHHEHYDGQGYPYGLQGEGIPLLARVVGIAQGFDHLTADHPGRPPLSVEQAIERIKRLAGRRFDPDLVDVITRAANDSATSLPTLAASSQQPLMPEL
jgi:cyclic di-GMP phosphodiesterase